MTGWMWVTLISVFLACFSLLLFAGMLLAEKARQREANERIAREYTTAQQDELARRRE